MKKIRTQSKYCNETKQFLRDLGVAERHTIFHAEHAFTAKHRRSQLDCQMQASKACIPGVET